MSGAEDKGTKLSSTIFPSSTENNEEQNNSQNWSESTNRKPGGWKAMPFILGNETLERLASFGLVANFMVYLMTVFHLDIAYAANIISIWNGVTSFLPIVGASISDAFVGRFKTIAVASFFSLLGMMLVTLTAWLPKLHPPSCTPQQLALGQCVKASSSQVGVLLMGLCLLSIGSAGVRPCSIAFGVDQFDLTTDKGRKGINSFFNWYYVSFTVVLVIIQTVVVYVQSSVSWTIGFAIPTVCMIFSIILFFVGTRIYVYLKPEGTIFSSFAQVLVAAYRKRNVQLPSQRQVDGIFYDPPLKANGVSKLPFTNQFRFLNKAALIMEGEVNTDGTRANQWKLVSIQQVEEVKCIGRVFPIWIASMLSLVSVQQQGTFTVSQAMKMDRHLGSKFQIPAGSIVVISYITLASWVPLYDRVFVPAIRRVTKHEGGITLLQRIGIGMVFSILSMVASGLVEQKRRDLANSNPNPLGIAPMSAMWLAPQLILIGLCEAFNVIGQIEFFNKQFPEHMRSIGNAVFACSFAGASYISSFLVTIFHHTTRTHKHPDWMTNDINSGRLHYFYYLIAVIGILNFIFFLYAAQRYHYKGSVDPQDMAQDVELGSKEELEYRTARYEDSKKNVGEKK